FSHFLTAKATLGSDSSWNRHTDTVGFLTMTAAMRTSGHAPEAQRFDSRSRHGCALYGPYSLPGYACDNAGNSPDLCILIAALGKDRIPCDWDRDRTLRSGTLRPICPLGTGSRSDNEPRLGRDVRCLIRRSGRWQRPERDLPQGGHANN